MRLVSCDMLASEATSSLPRIVIDLEHTALLNAPLSTLQTLQSLVSRGAGCQRVELSSGWPELPQHLCEPIAAFGVGLCQMLAAVEQLTPALGAVWLACSTLLGVAGKSLPRATCNQVGVRIGEAWMRAGMRLAEAWPHTAAAKAAEASRLTILSLMCSSLCEGKAEKTEVARVLYMQSTPALAAMMRWGTDLLVDGASCTKKAPLELLAVDPAGLQHLKTATDQAATLCNTIGTLLTTPLSHSRHASRQLVDAWVAGGALEALTGFFHLAGTAAVADHRQLCNDMMAGAATSTAGAVAAAAEQALYSTAHGHQRQAFAAAASSLLGLVKGQLLRPQSPAEGLCCRFVPTDACRTLLLCIREADAADSAFMARCGITETLMYLMASGLARALPTAKFLPDATRVLTALVAADHQAWAAVAADWKAVKQNVQHLPAREQQLLKPLMSRLEAAGASGLAAQDSSQPAAAAAAVEAEKAAAELQVSTPEALATAPPCDVWRLEQIVASWRRKCLACMSRLRLR